MTACHLGDMSLRRVIEDMRMGRHPAKQWEIDKSYWEIRTISTYMGPSPEVQAEAWAEFRALKLDAPVKPYDRHPALQD